MSIKEDLEIFLITYNRLEYLTNTFKQLLADDSPVKDFQITVLDNNSTDGTSEFLQGLSQKHPNINHIINKYNIGVSANSIKPFEMASKKYFWQICDDDFYDWSNWHEVEKAIENENEIICVTRFIFDIDNKQNLADIILQLSFIPAGIYKTSSMNDTLARNLYETVYSLFPYMAITLEIVNKERGRNIYVCSKSIVNMGTPLHPEIDLSYTRGSELNTLCSRTRTMGWLPGWCNIVSIIEDKNLKSELIEIGYKKVLWAKDFDDLISRFVYPYIYNKESWRHLMDIYVQLDKVKQTKFINIILKLFLVENTQKVFLIKNEGNHKVLRFLGISAKFRRRTT